MNTKSYNTNITPTWCPGCGNFGIFNALKQALAKLKLSPHQVVIVTDVGCSGNLADFVNTYRLHALHGRAIATACGIKLANHNLPVIAVIGDGGCYGEGLTHYINLMRGNHDITVLVHNNYLYSLTTGQYSPTTPKGTITKSTPKGSIEEPFNPLAAALLNQASFVSRGYAFDIPHLTDLICQAVKHSGFSLVDILQPCVTFNKDQTLAWYKQKVRKLKSSFKTKNTALQESLKTDKLAVGVFWQEEKLSYHQEAGLDRKSLIQRSIEKVDIKELMEEFV